MNVQEAVQVYDVLVEECGARGYEPDALVDPYDEFAANVTRPGFTEYRFCGALGFGGKFWDANHKWYVSCYPEERTPERDSMIVAANLRLEALRETFRGTDN